MTILLDKLCFGEGPRWREGMLWFSDMHAQKVLKVDPQGNVETVVELDDDQPSGLGWLPNGDLLIVAMTKKQVLRFNGSQLSVHADLSSLASHFCNDMVVDHVGRAYVGNFGFDIHNGAQQSAAELICVEVDGSASCVDDDLIFPNGAVITPDNKTLIVAETFASRLTAFDILDSGDLTNKRIWAQLPKGAVPDGICLDAGGGIWSASPTSNNCIRQIEGGEVTHTIELERGAFACMIGEANLYILTSTVSTPAACKANQDARIEVYPAPFRAAGLP
ncbi:MAG: SMP-30/gluconolactonase/LRE family protein [Pseudomonadales bacterium]|nr:SMP-30/gluconolactonase/LRE family protein [Pseudomonadales bacterium]